MTVNGWSCDHLPYLVELDNYGESSAPGTRGLSKKRLSKLPGFHIKGECWTWGRDEITWFAV